MAGEFATDYDGTNDYYTRGSDLAGNANSKLGIFSAWVRIDGGTGSALYIVRASGDIQIIRNTSNKFQFFFRDVVDTTALNTRTTTSYTTNAAWRHLLASWNLGTATSHLYIDDSSDNDETVNEDLAIDYTQSNYAVGATVGGATAFNGAISEVYFAPGQYLDFSVEANRRKFISAAGKSVPLGPTGNLPTGTSAIIYAPDGNPTVNQGTGGNFTENGAPVRIAGPNKRTVNAALISGV